MKNAAAYLSLLAIFAVPLLFYPSAHSAWVSSSDVHALLEFSAALAAVTAGMMVLLHFFTTGSRLFIVISCGLMLVGAEQFVHGVISFDRAWTVIPPAFKAAIPGTWLSGHFVLAGTFLLALLFRKQETAPENRPATAAVYNFVAFIIGLFVSALLFYTPFLPDIVQPGSQAKKIVDFCTASLYFVAFISYAWLYFRTTPRRMIFWCLAAFLASRVLVHVFTFNAQTFYDAYWDLGHLTVLLSYFFPIFGIWAETLCLHNTSKAQVIELNKTMAARLRDEESIRQERERLAGIIRGTNVGTWEWNVQTGETVFNERWAEIIGHTLDELSPVSIETWMKLVHPDDLKISEERLQKHFSGELNYYECETRMRHKSGAWVWVLDRGRVTIWTDDGKPLMMMGIHQDITQHKRAEEALQASERFRRDTLDSLPSSIAVLDENGIILAVNRSWEQFAIENGGNLPAVSVGINYLHVCDTATGDDSEEAALVADAIRSVMRGEQIRINIEYPCHSPDKKRWFLLRTARFASEGLVRVVVTHDDITERKRIETALRESEETYHNLFEAMQEGFALHQIICDDSGRPCDYRFLEVNSAFERVTGIPRERWIGHTVREVLPQVEDFWIDNYGEVALTGMPRTFEHYVEQLDQHYDVVAYSPKRGQFAVIALNVTERKRAEIAVLESTQFNQQIIDSAQEGIIVYGPDLRYQVWNPFMEVLSGFKAAEVLGKQPWDVFPFLQEAGLIDRLKLALSGEMPKAIEFPFNVNGKTGWTRDTSAPLRSAKGEIIGVIAAVQDITERKQAEEVLRSITQRFQLATQSAGLGIWDWDVVNNHMVWDDRMLELYGHTRESFPGGVEAWERGLHPEDRDRAWEECQHALRGEKQWKTEFRVRHPNGAVLHVKADGMVIRDENGKPLRMLGVNYDITERKQAEEVIKSQENFIRAVLDNLPIGIAVNSVGSEVQFQYMNDNFPTFYRSTKRDLQNPGAFWEALYEDPAYREVMRKRVLEDCASGDPVRMCWEDVPITRAGEKTSYISARNTQVPGRPLMISSVWDVTARVMAEQDRMRYYRLAESSGEFIGMCDLDLQPVYVNPAGRRMLGLPDMEAACRVKVPDYFFPEDQQFIAEEFFPRVLRDGQGSVEVRLRHFQTGEPLWFYYYLFSVQDIAGKPIGWATTSHNITERKQAEVEREKLQAQLTQAQKMESVGRLAGGVAHDFNNMLGAILMNTDMALQDLPPDSPLREHLQEIENSARRSADLTRQLLAFARKQTIAPKVLDLNATVEGMLKLLRRLIGEDIALAWLPAAGLGPVKIDPSQIDQLLANLCVNARDAIAGVGKLTIETGNVSFDEAYASEHAGYVPGNYVLLAVSDNGCGMDKEVLGHLFEPFFTTKGVGQGTGLGLATVYGIVKQNLGFINVYSEPGNGTTFKIYLPRHTDKADQSLPASPARPASGGHETILLVEDEPSLLRIGRRALEGLGYTVLAASTPGEAIHLAGEYSGHIQLLITDVVMPEMNGRDLNKRLLSLYPNLKSMFISGYTANVIAHHGVLDEGIYFLQKPFTVEALAEKVREALGA